MSGTFVGRPVEMVYTFCYLGDMITDVGGAEQSSVAIIRFGWRY